VSDANTALSSDTGGRRIGLTNDFSRPLRGVMADASSYYLLGYESPATTADGKFRKIDVDVKRSGVRVIARNGYWAPRQEELRTAATAAVALTVPPDVAEALDSLRDQARRTAVTEWVGLSPLDSGQSQVTVVFEALSARDAPKVRSIDLQVALPNGVSSQFVPLEGPPGVWVLRLEAPPGRLRMRVSVRNTAGEEVDNWARDTVVPPPADSRQVGTPVVYRPASVQQYRALMAGTDVPPAATRRFRRTDRAVVRLAMGALPQAPVDVQLLNRQGIPLRTMSTVTAPIAGERQVELPLGNLAFADYVLRFTITLPDGKTNRLVPFSMVP
jgi:hypothetical protein